MAEENQNISGANQGQHEGPNQSDIEITPSEQSEEIFNPQAALAGLKNYLAFNNAINKMIGIEARWFRAVPQQRSKDVIVNEYTLYNTEGEAHCIKVVVPDGNFPDAKYQYDLMGLEYEVPLTIHIDKGYWAEEFGYNTAPQKKDIVYLPMPNKLYQVESSYLERGFMEQETHWVINLRKYQPEASRRESDELKETIDKYTVSEEELFSEEIDKEKDQITSDQQFSPKNMTYEDKFKTIDENLKVISANLNIYGVLVSESFYDLRASKDPVAVKYSISDYISENDDRSLLAWFMSLQNTNKVHNVSWIMKDDSLAPPSNYKVKIKTTDRYNVGDTLTFYLSNSSIRFYAEVTDNSNATSSIYQLKIDKEVENYLSSLRANWANLKNFKVFRDEPTNVLSGENKANKGFDVNIYSNKYIKTEFGHDSYITILPNLIEDNKWYGVVVNLGNTWNQYNIYLWEAGPSEDKKLKINYYETVNLEPRDVNIDNYQINRSHSFLTNIRLFSSIIEEENQDKELLAFFSENSDYGIILDNSEPRFSAPYISQQR